MRNKLISGLAGAACSFAASGLAFAQVPPPAPAPVYNWTGWYAGVNAGASFGSANTDIHDATTVTATVVVTGTHAGTLPGASTFGLGGSNTNYPSGFMGGGQIGYNWQYSPLIVVGLEADFQGALERDSFTRTDNFSGPLNSTGLCPPPAGNFCGFFSTAEGSRTLDFHTQIDWFGTVRGRIGYVWGNGNVMSYLTGGLAYGEVKINGTSSTSGTTTSVPFSVTESFGQSHVNTGWVAGYGTEGVIDFWGARNWTWKIEGLWMDLGSVDATGTGIGPHSTGAPLSPCFGAGTTCTVTAGANGQATTHTHFTDGILRAGLNYKFY
jgi:outer membrane immunogenic protein